MVEEREVGIIAPIFVLNDPLEIEDFREAVEPMLPEFYIVSDVSSAFSNLESSMERMLWIADIVLVVSMVTTLLILSLLITLFLRDHRYVMGIYLS